MHKIIKSSILLLSSVVILGGVFGALASKQVSASANAATGFKAGNIIDDATFTKYTSMSVSQIQSFLNSKVPTCDTNGTKTSEYGGGTRAQYGRSKGNPPPYTCLKNYKQNGKSAAQIIYDTAHTYRINPQVFIVLLQKEQGLVTDDWPWSFQYRTATGYGCPDTASCDSQYYGFTNQLKWAGTMFRAIMDDSPTWYTPYVVGTNYVQYNPNGGCGGSTVNIVNLATAALYNYTPYQPNHAALNAGYGTGDSCSAYGNRNFWLYFNDWFGASTGGYLVQGSGAGIYLVDGSKKHLFPSTAMLEAYGLKGAKITAVSSDYLSSLEDGGAMNHLFKKSDSGNTVYLADSGKSYGISSGALCVDWAYDCNTTVTLGPDIARLFPSNGLLEHLQSSKGAIYLMNDGKKEIFLSLKAITENGYALSATPANNSTNNSQPSGVSHAQNDSLVKYGSSAAINYYVNDKYYYLSSLESYRSWFTSNNTVYADTSSTYAKTPPTTTAALPNIVVSGGKKYLVDQGRKIDLSAVNSNWPTGADGADLTGRINQLTTMSASVKSVFRTPNGAIFAVENSQKRGFVSLADFYALGYNSTNIINVLPSNVSSLSSGPAMLAPGKIIKKSTSPAFVLLAPNNKSYALSSLSDVSAFRKSLADVLTVDDATYNRYVVSPTPLRYFVKNSTGNSYTITPQGYRISTSADFMAKWGITDGNYITLDDATISKIPLQNNQAKFASYNGTIYYGLGGKKRPISSYHDYIDLGGSSNNTFSASKDFVSTAPLGPSYP